MQVVQAVESTEPLWVTRGPFRYHTREEKGWEVLHYTHQSHIPLDG